MRAAAAPLEHALTLALSFSEEDAWGPDLEPGAPHLTASGALPGGRAPAHARSKSPSPGGVYVSRVQQDSDLNAVTMTRPQGQ